MKDKLCTSLSLLIFPFLILFSGCTKTADFLELPDHDGIDGRIWDKEGALEYFLTETYQVIMPEFPYQNAVNNSAIVWASDENAYSCTNEWPQKVFNAKGTLLADNFKYIGVKYQGTNIGDNRYFDISKCNMALDNIPGGSLDEATKKRFIGQFYALRGFAYFNLTKYYGGVPLITKTVNPLNVEVVRRSKARDMFKQIIADFDAAIESLDGVVYQDRVGRFTKEAVAVLKAKALLFWASPLFNPINDGAHKYEPARWQEANEAARKAYEMCRTAGYDLMPSYSNIFLSEGAGNKEALLIRSYNTTTNKRGHNVEGRSRPASENGSADDCYKASVRMIEAYTMKDGLPAKSSSGLASNYTYDERHFWLNRDPRFDATIVVNGALWPLSSKPNRRQWSYEGGGDDKSALYCKRFSVSTIAAADVKYGDIGGNGLDWIELRFAELMLIYAETANEVGDLGTAKEMVRAIRKRAGIVEGSYDYGLALATDKDKMRDLILNERMVEFAFEGKRNDDLRRTRRMHLLSGALFFYQQGPKLVANTYPGDNGTTLTTAQFLAKPLASDPSKVNRDTINMNNMTSVDKFFQPYDGTNIPNGVSGMSMPEYYYFFGFNNVFLQSSSLLEQTIGWDGGTFDPLD